MSRRKATVAPVTLFPFLAVLMCTMGALIVLLVLVSAQVRDAAVARARQELTRTPAAESAETSSSRQPPLVLSVPAAGEAGMGNPALQQPEPLPPEPDLTGLHRRLSSLRKQQQTLQRSLAERQAGQSALRAELERVQQKTSLTADRRKKVETQIQRVVEARDASREKLEALNARRQQLQAAVQTSTALIAQRQHERDSSSEFVVVPFDGEDGTTRRPIIIECTDHAIRFVSEKITLTPNQLLGFTPESNPLLAGANEIVRFWSTYNSVQDHPESEPVPYILLVVRPSGTVGFYLARRFLAGLGADYGYELVARDFEYSVPESDPRAREMALAAITGMLATGSPHTHAETFSETLSSGRLSSGTGPNGATGRGPASGGTRRGTGTFSGMTDSGQDMQRFDSRTLRRGGRSASQSFFSSENFQKHQRRDSTGIPGSRNLSAAPSLPQSVSGADPSSGTGQLTRGARGTAGNQEIGLPRQPGSSRLPGSPVKPERPGSARPPAVPSPSIATPGTVRDTATDRSSTDRSSTGRNSTGRNSTDRSSTGATRRTVGPDRTGTDSTLPDRGGPPGHGLADVSSQPDTGGTRGQPPAEPSAKSVYDSIEETTHPLLRNQTVRTPGQTPGRPPGSSFPAQTPTEGGTPLPLPAGPDSENGTPSSQRESLLSPRSQGRRHSRQVRRQWGNRNPAGTIALEKPIVIRAARDRIVIGGRFKITRTVDRSARQIADLTVLAVDRVAREWGVPPQRFYWVPAITLVIEPGGELLRGPLEDQLRRNSVSVETQFSNGTVLRSARSGDAP